MSLEGAGYRADEIRGNHAQVVVPQQAGDEICRILATLGGNLVQAAPGRKHVFDAFMQGRLVSLLALGLSIRQAAACLGVSHVAVLKELKRNAELHEQIAAARFQAQVEPLLVILRESRRSWRAATWLVSYLSKQLAQREETLEEAKARREAEEQTRRDSAAESARRAEIEEQIETAALYGGPSEEEAAEVAAIEARKAKLRARRGL